MKRSGKRPGVAFWATVVVVVLLVAYPLSFGPACWLADSGLLPEKPAIHCYRPLIRAVVYDYPIVGPALHWYGDALSSRTRFFTALSSMCELVAHRDILGEIEENGRNIPRRLIMEPCEAFRR